MQHALGMAVGKCIQQLAGPHQHLCLRLGAFALDPLGQAFARDEVHHQVFGAAPGKEIRHAHQMGMIQACQGVSFLLELLAQLGQHMGIQTRLGDHLFDRYVDV
jgi:hypothetical protein